MVNHGKISNFDKYSLKIMLNHGQPWSTMVNHCQILHYGKNCLHIKIMDNHGQPWSAMVDDGQPCIIESNMVNHGQSWLNMFECRVVTKIVLI